MIGDLAISFEIPVRGREIMIVSLRIFGCFKDDRIFMKILLLNKIFATFIYYNDVETHPMPILKMYIFQV